MKVEDLSPANIGDIQDKEQQKAMFAEWILRIAALERTLIKKGIFSKEELNESFTECLVEFGQIIASRQGVK